MLKDTLGDRMKLIYENPCRFYLKRMIRTTRRTPVVIRVNGIAFRTFTRNFPKPFSAKFMDAMIFAALHVAREAAGFKLGYVQSDEASFLLTDYDRSETQPWFGYNKSKLESVSASIMTAAFNRAMRLVGVKDLATFDARAFGIPESEIANYFLWRATNWSRNSVLMYAQAYFSHRELQGKSRDDMLEMLHGVDRNWSFDLVDAEKNGTFIIGAKTRDDVPPKYTSINELWESVKP